MDSDLLAIGVLPHDLLLCGHLKQLGSVRVCTACCVTGDDDMAVGKHLRTTRILQPVSGKVIIGQRPDDLSVGIEINDAISVRAADERLIIAVTNGSERPSVNLVFIVAGNSRVQFFEHVTVAGVVKDGKVQQMRGEECSIGQFASHSRLHVMILLLTGERKLDNDFSVWLDFEEPGIVSRFGDDERAVGGRVSAVDLTLRPLPDEGFLPVWRDLHNGAAAVFPRFAKRQNDGAVVQDVAISGGSRISPASFAILFHDVGVLAAREKAVRDLLCNGTVANESQEECRP